MKTKITLNGNQLRIALERELKIEIRKDRKKKSKIHEVNYE